MPLKVQATIEDLYHVPENGKAEIVNGELRLIPPTGDLPGSAAGEIRFTASARAAYRRGTSVPRQCGVYSEPAESTVVLPRRSLLRRPARVR